MSPRHAARTRRPVVLAAVTVAAVLGGCVAAGAHSLGRTPDAVPSAAVSSPSPAASPQGTVPTAEAAVDLDAALARALEPVDGRGGASLSVAVLDTVSGDTAVYGGAAYDTASIVKVGVLAALLLRAQDDGRSLTAEERARAAAMIRLSDNDAATALFTAVGGRQGSTRPMRGSA
ncbi:hypothetical protein [Streptomyces sp. NPDC096193]|uniref:hypothetical protein n=1 Tax=Streptomyces sp. NPDC096193 TaxID=3155821 RepID=UPI003321F021